MSAGVHAMDLPAAPARWIAFAWRAWRGLTPRHFGYALVLGLSMGLLGTLGAGLWQQNNSLQTNAIMMLASVIPSTLVLLLSLTVAVNIRTTRMPAWLPYVLAAVLSTLAFVPLDFACVRVVSNFLDVPQPDNIPVPILLWINVPQLLLINTLVALGYKHFCDSRRRLKALRDMQLGRMRMARESYESRLKAMEARVEPQFLFDTLRVIEQLYKVDGRRAEGVLNDLIAFLRAVLPGLDQSQTMVATEFALVRAYLGIARERTGGRLEARVDYPASIADARVPPMVLMPLVEYLVERALAAPQLHQVVAVEATPDGDRLKVRVGSPAGVSNPPPIPPAASDVRERLEALYGNEFEFTQTADDVGVRLEIEIPFERVELAPASPRHAEDTR